MSSIYMIPLKDLEAHKAFNNLGAAKEKVDHVDFYYNAGHPFARCGVRSDRPPWPSHGSASWSSASISWRFSSAWGRSVALAGPVGGLVARMP